MRRVAVLAVLLFVVAATPFGVVTAAATGPTDGATGPGAVASQDAPGTASSDNATGASAANGSDGSENDDAAAGASSDLAPGAQLAGVIAVQQAEIDGELEQRSYEVQITTSKSEESRADVVSRQLNQVDGQLADLRQRLSELEKARRKGNISEGRYRATAARLSAEIRSARKMLNETEETATDLSAEMRRSNDIGEKRLSRLQNGVENLSELSAAAARDLSGPDVGNGLAGGDVVNETKITGDETCSVAVEGRNRSINRSATAGNDSLNGSAGARNASTGNGTCGNATIGNVTNTTAADALGAGNRSNATGNATGMPELSGRNNTTARNVTAENASQTPATDADSRDDAGNSGRDDASDRRDDGDDTDSSAPDNSGNTSGQGDAVGTNRSVTTNAEAGTTTDAETGDPDAKDLPSLTAIETPTDSVPIAAGDDSVAPERTETETATSTSTDTPTETETASASEADDDAQNASKGSSDTVDTSEEAVETKPESESESETETETETESSSDTPDDSEGNATGVAETAGGSTGTLTLLSDSDVL